MKHRRELLEMALAGYARQREIIEQKMAEIRSELGGAVRVAKVGKPAGKRQMSAEGRARIAAATRARWAAYRKAKAAA